MIIFHIPHSSCRIPEEYRDQFILTDDELKIEARIMADLFVDKLAEAILEEKIIFPISRIVCDVERFRDDKEEEMAKVGMGVVYTKCHNLSPLRKEGVDAEKIKSTLYDPHHKLFEGKVNLFLKSFGRCFIIDLHSYSDEPLPYELHKEDARPDICLGFDDAHIDRDVVNKIKMLCEKEGFSVKENEPFKGSIVPLGACGKDDRVKSLMIEINKKTYLQEFEINKSKFDKLQKLIQEIVDVIKESY
jgi:N-formylglutamate amidohydrolase